MMKKITFLFSLCCWGFLLQAQENCMEIGTNYHFFNAGVFKDLKQSSSHFFTRNASYIGDDNDWDSGLANTMPQDEAGYPLEIPFNHPVTGQPQIVAFTIGGYDSNYRAGNYVMLFDGTASFDFANWTGATVTATSAGRIEFTIDYVDENGVHIEILSTPLSNHVHNIRIVETSYESNFETEILYPSFSEKSNEFIALRFMDWIHTNNHPVSDWSERTKAQFHTQNIDHKGMSWEQIINIGNEMEKDIWINVPHLANQSYIDSMALLFRDHLDSDLTIYLEYSNECWNWIFDQTHWLEAAAPHYQSGRNYGHYSKIVFERWDMIFAGQEHRIKTVLGGHDYFVLDALEIFDNSGDTDLVDLVSYPGYVALDEDDYETLNMLGSSATAQDVMNMLHNNQDEQFYWMEQFKTLVADAYSKEFVMYEGGQHITPEWFGLDTSYNQALYDAQIHADMYAFYQGMLTYYQNDLDIKLFMNYVLASPQENPFGSWGLLETYFSTAPFPPKWNAVMDWKTNNPSCVLSNENMENSEISFSILPNPSSYEINISMDTQLSFTTEIYNTEGKLVQVNQDSNKSINIENLPSGIYFLRLKTKDGIHSSKFIKR